MALQNTLFEKFAFRIRFVASSRGVMVCIDLDTHYMRMFPSYFVWILKKKVKARVLLCLFHMTSGLVVPMCTSCLADDANIDGMLPKRWTLDEFKHLSGFIRYTQSQILLIIIGLNNSKLFDCLKQSRKKIKRYVHLHVY